MKVSRSEVAPRHVEVNLSPERVKWFAEYYRRHPGWGIFHVSLALGSYQLGASDHIFDSAPYTEAELREQAAWFNRLSATQRRRLARRAEDIAHTVVRR